MKTIKINNLKKRYKKEILKGIDYEFLPDTHI